MSTAAALRRPARRARGKVSPALARRRLRKRENERTLRARRNRGAHCYTVVADARIVEACRRFAALPDHAVGDRDAVALALMRLIAHALPLLEREDAPPT
jgi:hypothetical protein